MDAKGGLAIALKDGSVLRGTAYKNWVGLVGTTAKGGVARLARQKLPARVAFLQPGTIQANGLEISASLKESMQEPYGQRGYLDWAMKLEIRNASGASLKFGDDIILMDCAGGLSYDGDYVAYSPLASAHDPGNPDFDAEAQAYSIANFARWWSDGTMREFRNGGTYSMGDPPDFKPERTTATPRSRPEPRSR